MIILLVFLLFLSSCSVCPDVVLSCHIPANHPYEEASGKAMWHKVIYFDGEKLCYKNIDSGVRNFSIKVKRGGLRPIIVIPLNKLSPLGGFYEDGKERNIELYSEYGNFASMLINASEYRPKVISSLSIDNLKSNGYDIGTIEQTSFLEYLFDGTLDSKKLVNAPYFHPELDSIASGYWISDSVCADSFYMKGDKIKLSLFSGVYNFWNKEKDLLLTLVISEDGRFYTSMDRLPDLY